MHACTAVDYIISFLYYYRFDLIVTATDLDVVNPLSATASLTITILDLNDNVPKFSQPIYVENDIVENAVMVSIQVSASDEDINENSELFYEIVDGNSDDQFTIGKYKKFSNTVREIGHSTSVAIIVISLFLLKAA